MSLLDIHTVEELSHQDPTALFQELERQIQKKQDPFYRIIKPRECSSLFLTRTIKQLCLQFKYGK
ncbi:MAG TPA: hypothetical protein DCY54_05775 [Parachlamydiales bacterium]|nr:hypothetical protein [Parachlamydiales bacterium]